MLYSRRSRHACIKLVYRYLWGKLLVVAGDVETNPGPCNQRSAAKMTLLFLQTSKFFCVLFSDTTVLSIYAASKPNSYVLTSYIPPNSHAWAEKRGPNS